MTGGFFDGPNPFDDPEQPATTGGFFDGPNPFANTDTRGFFDLSSEEFDALNQQAASVSPFGRALHAVGVVGKTLQPLAAPQQIIFGGIGGLEDLLTGEGAEAAWNTLKRGGSSALAYATYQHGGDLPGFLKNKSAPQSNPIFGYDLFKKAGAPQWVARWGGTAADFLLDVPLLGVAAKATKADKLTAGLRIGENMAQAFDSPAALRAFAGGVAAAPFTTQPIKRFVEAVPLGIRQTGRERLVDPLLNMRSVPRAETGPVGPTVGQYLIGRNMGVPAPVVSSLERKQAVMSQYTVLNNEALSAFQKAKKGLSFTDGQELDKLVGRLADESDVGLRAGIEGQIRAMETRTGRKGLFDDAMTATNKGIQFDVFSAEKLHAAGLMSKEALQKYQAGDLRHLRRVYALYGERGEDQLRRILDRNAPAQVIFDRPALEQLYSQTLNSTRPLSSTYPPSPGDFADAVQRAYTNPDQHPADFLKTFFDGHGMDETHIADILTGIGKNYAERAGIQWRPSDEATVRYFTQQRAATATGGQGSQGTRAVTTQREEISDLYADVLGEIESFTKRISEQARVASRAASTGGVVQDIRKYLVDNDLIEQLGAADMGSIHKTAGLRVVSAEQARALGNGFKEGEVLPAEIHRILAEQVSTRADSAPLGLAWQWYSSRWQGIKLANPASIATNLKSTFVMADHAGHSVPDLLRGMYDYLLLHNRATRRGDGAMDTAAQVNGVTMNELFHHGAFTHNTLLNAEVTQRSNRLMEELANPAGSGLQRKVAAIQEWLTETQGGARTAGAYQFATKPMRWLGDTYGRVDSLAKGGLYMSLRRKGVKPEVAARTADETFFNYENVPYVVDGLRRFGLLGMPFASFKFLATGRFLRSLYQNPYGVAKYYRLPNSSRAAMNDEEGTAGSGKTALQEYDEGSPSFIRQGLYVPLGKDKEGRYRAVRLDDILPETAIFDSFNADGVAGTIPPAIQQIAQLVSGKGYQGRDVYRGGGTFADVGRDDPTEAVRGIVKQLWQFGSYPWAPGQPMTERIVKAIADKAVPVETITDERAQAGLKILTEGPAAIFDEAPWSAEKRGSQPVPDVADALARVFGVKIYPVDPNPGRPGSAYYNRVDLEQRLQAIDRRMDGEMKQAVTPEQQTAVRARYAELRAPILKQLRGE